ncbi:MAG: SDR family oxidoreductase [Pseudomonadota bacterium]
MANTALITGASGGIGEAFARYHASKSGDLVLVARREEALEALKGELEQKHGVSVHVIAQDMAEPDAAQKVMDGVKAAGVTLDILINNAGFGGHGKHIERDLAEEMAMVDLNVKGLMALTHATAKDMVARGVLGRILNVSSTAGFVPGPLQAVYFATKAFVTSYSEAVNHELRDTGVTITVLAPGYVETNFADRADLEGTKLVQNNPATPESVAKHGYDAMMARDTITINDPKLRFMMRWLIPLSPRKTVLKMIEDMQAK